MSAARPNAGARCAATRILSPAFAFLFATAVVRTAAAQVVFATDFDSGLPAAISAPGTVIESVQGFAGLGPAGRQFQGSLLHYGSTSVQPVTLTLFGLPPHTSVDLAFLLAIIDSWDGVERFEVRVDGQLLFSHTFDHSYGTTSYVPPAGGLLASGTNLGFSGGSYYYVDRAYDLGVEPVFRAIPHTSPMLTVQWTVNAVAGPYSGNWQGGTDESWAIDAVRIWVGNGNATPFGSGCGQPALTATPAPNSLPFLGRTQLTDVTNVPAGVAFMALGLSNTQANGAPLPLRLANVGMPGCDLRIDPSVFAQSCVWTSANVAQHALPIRNSTALAGLSVYLQAWAPAPGVNAAGLVVSNGVALAIGASY